MNLYAIKMPNGKWGMVRNKAKAVKLAKEVPGAEVWSRPNVPEIDSPRADAWNRNCEIVGWGA
jgi:hypothetical protein